ncbi:hypothetical protein EV586_101460 [Tumebacillus sp. BK434]|uniref:hypothetical protein n=1 Tax=Tumebacillus sp. BK434 TaxID=2512169 RepID=UPI00104A8C2F|nr:hypothetical protein [Tumebacillus sp. BK434]TCP59244.1 hypothetical protein EV586_101460 [Tumebacillus sp. BK434]
MSERQAEARAVVVFERAERGSERTGNVIPFPTGARSSRETAVVDWMIGGNGQQPQVRLTGVTSGFGDVTKASPQGLAA